eukprot:10016735-Ditylum_brightwellii.AAC.1
MKQFTAEIRRFIVRLAFITAVSDDRKKTYKLIKDKEVSVGNMSCQESVAKNAEFQTLEGIIKGKNSKK